MKFSNNKDKIIDTCSLYLSVFITNKYNKLLLTLDVTKKGISQWEVFHDDKRPLSTLHGGPALNPCFAFLGLITF